MIHSIFHKFICYSGTIINLITVFVILAKTPKTLKEYSSLLLHDCLAELFSVLAHFIVNGRIFVSSASVVIVADSACCAISDEFCSILTGFLNVNMIHSVSLIAIQFWYRTRILQEKHHLGVLKLQLACLFLFAPHLLDIVGFVYTITPNIELSPVIDRFYDEGYAHKLGLYGYSNVVEPIPMIIAGYLIVFTTGTFTYIGIARIRLLSILREKAGMMSEKTRSTHSALAKVLRALTIHAALPIFVSTVVAALVVMQLRGVHTVDIEGLAYDVAVLPALINPCLTLYFVRPYREFIGRLIFPRSSKEVSSIVTKSTISRVMG